MANMSRRTFMVAGTALAGAISATGISREAGAADKNGFMAASTNATSKEDGVKKGPGLQRIFALCEVTGGGAKIYGIAAEYDADIDPTSLALTTFKAEVIPAAEGFFAGMPNEPDKNATQARPLPRAITSIYTHAEPALLAGQSSVTGRYVIVEFAHDPDLSLPTQDSDIASLTQVKNVKTLAGHVYAASNTPWSNAAARGNNVVIRGVDEWEQHHWWWDDTHSAWLEYSIYLPKSFLNNQQALTEQVNHYLDEGGNITFLTFKGVDHMASARKFFYINAARAWLFKQQKA